MAIISCLTRYPTLPPSGDVLEVAANVVVSRGSSVGEYVYRGFKISAREFICSPRYSSTSP